MKLYRKKNKILILVIIVLLIFSLNIFSKDIRNFFYSISSPIQKTLWRARDNLSDYFDGIFREKNLEKEVEKLRLENQRLLAENIALNETKSENETLRRALELGLADEFQLDFAEVVAKYADQDAILIDKGLKDGLSKDMSIITQDKVLVGKIDEVYEDFSRVLLISQKENSFDVKISGKDIEALLRGKGRSEIYLDLVPRDKEIKEGDLVISSSFSRIYPSGLLIGKISQVTKNDIQPFQQAEISPFLDLLELDKVFIILE